MTGSPALRALRGDDLGALALLHRRCFPAEPWDRDQLRLLLAQPGCHGLLAEGEDGAPAGLLLLRCAADEAEVLALAVDPALRRRGLARALLLAGLGGLIAAGVRQLFLEVAADNAAARGLYGGFGFREVGRRPRYYRGGGDALVLRLAVADEAARSSDKAPIKLESSRDKAK